MKSPFRGMALASIFALALPSDATFLQAKVTSQDSSAGGLSTAMEQLEQYVAEDTRFFTAEWTSLENQLTQLESAVEPPKVVAKENSSTEEEAPMKLDIKSVAELAPALAMLKGLYEDGKQRIAQLNVREKKSKEYFEARSKKHNATIARIEARFANHTLREGFRVNETKTENRLFLYWSQERGRSHESFHTGLKLQHATLSRVKKMMDLYEKAMSGKDDQVKQAKVELTKIAAPEIMFLQERQSAVKFCRDALAELRETRTELSKNNPLQLL